MLAGVVAANSRKTPKRFGVVAARRFGEQANHHSLSSPSAHRDEVQSDATARGSEPGDRRGPQILTGGQPASPYAERQAF
jgi:hypothetical protein